MCAAYETTKRILVIDDDIDLLMLLERRLKQDEYEVDTAVSLTEAEELIPSFLPHLVLLDINVNGEDGRKLCYKMKQIYGDSIKVIIMTGYDYNQVMPVLFGADDLLSKPLHTEFLLHRISLHLLPKSETDPTDLISIRMNNQD
jgi:DNA-binding response OmpR family regulator